MTKNIDHLIKENEALNLQIDELHTRLIEANDIIGSIQKGKIDAVLASGNELGKLLVSKTDDQAYRMFIENMSEGVVTLLSDGMILYSNSSFARMVGFPLENVIGSNFRQFVPDKNIGVFEVYFEEYPPANTKVELTMAGPEAEDMHFIVSINTLQIQEFAALSLVWTDVTEQKQAAEKLKTINENLEQANAELATFAHIASHDLQEPLRKIMTYSSLLKHDYYGIIPEKGQEYMNKIVRTSSRMRELINDILDYSHVSMEKIVFKPVNLQTVIDDIMSDLEIVIQETGAEIKIEKELPVIEADSIQMRQLFQNLISNSLKFKKHDTIPRINIGYENKMGKEIEHTHENMQEEPFHVFLIRDNGIGFDPQYSNRIFTIFQRLNSNSRFKGTGIGLAICKKIVDKHHGYIKAESKLDEGTLFTVTLPVHVLGGKTYL
ncbi:MAG TPA: ATP-binding protein [Puia sp.]|nr:ATP-binding protein [Puia sp.]